MSVRPDRPVTAPASTAETVVGEATHGELPLGMPLFDPLTDLLIPLAILGMVGSFAYFLIDVRSTLIAGGGELLRYVFFWFLMGVVCISRMRSKYGSEVVAMPYVIGLAVAMGLFVLRFSEFTGNDGGGAGLAIVFMFCIVGLTWWAVNRLTDECTVEEDSAIADGASVLDGWTASVNVETVGRRRRHPGRLVIVFGLTALVVFALSQPFLESGAPGLARHAFGYMVICLFSALTLLALTALSGLRLYVRGRGVSLPRGLPSAWVAASLFVVIAILVFAALLPRVARTTGQRLVARVNTSHLTTQELPLEGPVEGMRAPRHNTSSRLGENGNQSSATGSAGTPDGSASRNGPAFRGAGHAAGAPPGAGGVDSGKAGGNSTGPSDSAPSPLHAGDTSTPQPPSEHETKPVGEPRSGDTAAKPEPSSPQGQQSPSAQTPPSEQPSSSEPTSSSAETPPSKPQSTAGSDQTSAREQHKTLEHPSTEPAPPRPLEQPWTLPPFGTILTALALIAVAIVLLILAGRWLRDYLSRHPGWKISGWLAALAAPWRHLGERFRGIAWRHKSGNGAAGKPFSNPFARRDVLDCLAPGELIAYTYDGILAYARYVGLPKRESQTPFEFVRALPEPLRELRDEISGVTRLYVQQTFTDRPIPAEHLDLIRSAWDTLNQTVQAAMDRRSRA